jgi:hypothetical protein
MMLVIYLFIYNKCWKWALLVSKHFWTLLNMESIYQCWLITTAQGLFDHPVSLPVQSLDTAQMIRIRFRQGSGCFSSLPYSNRLWGASSPYLMDTGVKLSQREAASSVQLNVWSYRPYIHCAYFMLRCLIMHRTILPDIYRHFLWHYYYYLMLKNRSNYRKAGNMFRVQTLRKVERRQLKQNTNSFIDYLDTQTLMVNVLHAISFKICK